LRSVVGQVENLTFLHAANRIVRRGADGRGERRNPRAATA
jgi:hypothetical protein